MTKDDEAVAVEMSRLKLAKDFEEVTGAPPKYFYCPITRLDEQTRLCKGHIVGKAVGGSLRTAQREDVDNFYGGHFESDFSAAVMYRENPDPLQAFADKTLYEKLRPQVFLDDKQIDSYYVGPNQALPRIRLEIETHSQTVTFGLKIPPENPPALDGKWETGISKDARTAALVSVIKAAHLTLFGLLGYRYALSLGGYELGYRKLGQFYLNNSKLPKAQILKKAETFFSDYFACVRIMPNTQRDALDLKGTITDHALFLCGAKWGQPWGIVVFVQALSLMHAVLVPVFDDPDSPAQYLQFTAGQTRKLYGYFARLTPQGWGIDPHWLGLGWRE